ncbi:hypothetical protein EYC84_004540 [Monilinia fructicola]|uniref:Uncharacterized protein n=1 Tax=Monilinia fructicola TaxID=38448 RepID=A0A5M9K4K3_MONFR|nr:hypothetical protein EYC84_004540 [Monilinia fructicola]
MEPIMGARMGFEASLTRVTKTPLRFKWTSFPASAYTHVWIKCLYLVSRDYRLERHTSIGISSPKHVVQGVFSSNLKNDWRKNTIQAISTHPNGKL